MVGLLALLALLLIALPPAAAVWMFVAVVLIVSGAAIYIGVPWLVARGEQRIIRLARRWTTTERESVARFLARLAVVLIALAAYAVRPGAEMDSVSRGLWLWLGAGVGLGLACWLWPHPLPVLCRAQIMTAGRTAQRIRWPLVIAGVVMLVILAEVTRQRFLIPALMQVSFHVQFALLMGGGLLLVIGFGGVRRAADRRDLWPLVGITLLAFALNTWQLGTGVHTFIDEFQSLYPLELLWNDPYYRLLRPFEGVPAFSSVYTYLQMHALYIFGDNFTGLRMASVMFGTLLPGAVYLLGRELFDRPTALIAALLLAVFPPQVHFSRIGINNIADPLFGVLALVFLVRGLRYGRHGDFAFSGVMLGLTQYFYEGGKLLYPLLFGAWLALILWFWRPWNQWRGLLALALCYVMVALPVYYLSFTSIVSYSPRLDSINQFEAYFQQMGRGLGGFIQFHYAPQFLHFFHYPDGSGFFYSNQVGLVLIYLVPLFMLGLALIVWRGRMVGALLLLWLLATVIGSSFVRFPASTPRFVQAFPLVVLLMAVGIRYTLPLVWPGLARLMGSRRDVLLHGLVLFMVVQVIVLPQVVFYFGIHLPDYNRQLRSIGRDIIDVMFRARDLPPETRIYFFHLGDNYVAEQRYKDFKIWWDDMPEGIDIRYVGGAALGYMESLPDDADVAVFLDPDDGFSIMMLYERFGWLPDPQYSPYNIDRDLQFVLYYFPHFVTSRLQPGGDGLRNRP